MSLLDHIRKHTTDERRTALGHYRILLAKADTATAEDAASILEVMNFLGKTTEQMTADAAAVRKLPLLDQAIASVPSLEADHAKRTAARIDKFNELEATKKRLEHEWRRLGVEEEQAMNLLWDAQRAAGIREKLVGDNPDLFGDLSR